MSKAQMNLPSFMCFVHRIFNCLIKVSKSFNVNHKRRIYTWNNSRSVMNDEEMEHGN